MALTETLTLNTKSAEASIKALGAQVQRQFTDLKVPPITIPPIKVPKIDIPATSIPPIVIPTPNTSGISAAFSAIGSQALGVAQGIGRAFVTAGNVTGEAIRKIGPPVALATGLATKSFVDFELSLSRVQGLTNFTARDVAGFRDQIISLGGATSRSPQELAQALYFVASSGTAAKDSMAVLEIAAKASAAGLGDTEVVARVLTGAINAYGKENLTAAQAGDILTQAVKEGAAEAADFAQELGPILPVAAKLGVGLDEVAAGMATLTNVGISAAESGTALRQVLFTILSPSREGAEALGSVGLSVAGLRKELDEKGLIATLGHFAKATEGNVDLQTQFFGNVRAAVGALSLMGPAGELAAKSLLNVQNSTGSLDESFAVFEKTSASAFGKFKAALQTLLITIGGSVAPALAELSEKAIVFFKTISQGFSDLSPSMKQFISYALLAVGALGALVALPFVSVSAGFVAIAAGVAATVGAFVTLRNRSEGFRQTIEAISEFVVNVAIPAFQDFVAEVVGTVRKWFNDNKGLINGVKKDFQELFRELNKFWDQHGEAIKQVLKVVGAIVGTGIFLQLKTALLAVTVALRILSAILKTVSTLLPIVSTGFTILGEIIGAAATVLRPIFMSIAFVVTTMVAISTLQFNLFRTAIETATEAIRVVIQTVWTAIQAIISAALFQIQFLIQTVLAIITAIWNTTWGSLGNVLGTVWATIQSVVSGGINTVRGVIEGGLNVLLTVWNSVWGGLGGAVTTALAVIIGPISLIVGAINTVVGSIGKLKDALGSIGEGGASLTDLTGAGLAIRGGKAILKQRGGPVDANRAYIVGEKRPELFVPKVPGVILPSVPKATALMTNSLHPIPGQGNSSIVNVYVNPPAGMSQKEATDLGGLIGQATKKAIQTSVRAI